MTSPRFLMHGIGGVYNYGCEAIVRGTEVVLREAWPDAIIKYASKSPEDDRRRLKNSNVEIVSRDSYSRFSARNICRKVAFSLGIYWYRLRESVEWLDDCDVVLSIGGDRYNLMPSGAFDREPIIFGQLVRRRGKKLVIWGASVGSFDKNERAKRILTEHLAGVDLITSREPESTEYLKSLGIESNLTACADPAFAVLSNETVDIPKANSLHIGVNLSPLSLRFVARGTDQYHSIISEQAKTIERIVNELDSDVILVPHVVCDFDKRDDDFRHLLQVKSMMERSVSERVEMLPRDLGFLGTRSALLRCNLVIAARMHCAINSIAAGIPTLLLSYSQKSIGMARYVYGNVDQIISIKEVGSDRFLDVIRNTLAQESDIRKHLQDRTHDIQSDVRNGVRALARIMP